MDPKGLFWGRFSAPYVYWERDNMKQGQTNGKLAVETWSNTEERLHKKLIQISSLVIYPDLN